MDYDILTVLGQIGSVGTAIGTLALVILFWKTITQLEETVKVSRIQSNYRFRPWIGPINKIETMSTTKDKVQYFITVKNYGELPASNVNVKFLTKNTHITRESLNQIDTQFSLGPLLPNMEKRYWFFIDSGSIKNAHANEGSVYTLIHFQYDHHSGTSGYGLVSKYDPAMGSFVHIDMWID